MGALSKYVPVISVGSNGEGFTLGECDGARQFGVVAVYVGDTLNNRDRYGVALTSRSLRGHLHWCGGVVFVLKHPFMGALSKYVPVISGGSNGEGFTLGECDGARQFGVVAVYVGDTLNNRDRHGVALTSRSLRGHLHRSGVLSYRKGIPSHTLPRHRIHTSGDVHCSQCCFVLSSWQGVINILVVNSAELVGDFGDWNFSNDLAVDD